MSEKDFERAEWNGKHGTVVDVGARIEELLKKDNARLRALIKQAEWAGGWNASANKCEWCDTEAGWPKPAPHTADCPAFTVTGEVK